MVMPDKVVQTLWEKKQRYPYLPDQQTLLRTLWEMNSQGGIPAVIGQYQGKEQLLLYTDAYYLALYETSWHDGYNIATLDIRNLNEFNRLSKGVLWIRAQEWHLCSELKSIPHGSSNYWDVINRSWQELELTRQQHKKQQEQQQEFTYKYEQYLDMVEDLIEVNRQLEQEKFTLNEGISYKKVVTAGGERGTLRDIYDFRLVEIPQLTEQTMLQIRGFPDLRGRVEALEGTKLTLKFESLVDRKRIPEQGSFEPAVSKTIYYKQREALRMLREREAKNVHLLRVLVDHTYQPYQPDSIAWESDEDLKSLTREEQFEAFRRALTVPDILMVLGPPGTGKTRTITEIARYCGLRRQRVLMASGTHKAVDNVLERLPPDLIVIRVGHESNVSEKMRAKLIDVQAKKLQEVMLENSENLANRLSRLLTGKHDIDGWTSQLAQGLGRLGGLESYLQQGYQRRSAAEQRVMAPFQGRLHELTVASQQLKERSTKLQERMQALIGKQQKASGRSSLPLLGWVFRALGNRYGASIEQKQQELQKTQQEIQARQQEYTQVQRIFQQTLFADADYQQCEQYVRSMAAECEKTWEALVKIARILQGIIIDLEPQQPSLEVKGAATLQHYLSWFQQSRAKLELKARLLQDWREELSEPDTDQLYPELLRYADVVGATCIGAATVKELEDLDFDLAIIDEAGQVGLPNLLVPLVRAKRAMLVGDHHQLPPFVDSEVRTWLRNLSSEMPLASEEFDEDIDTDQIADLVTKSAFEQLFTATTDRDHIVTFTKQGRMPRVIADFVSQHFYNNQLGTFDDARMQHTIDRDPLFRRHLVVIDISDEPSNSKWEIAQKRLESLGEAGYVNSVEARLIASIAEIYQKAGKDWVVIVPYRAQARRIIQELKQRLDDDLALEERIATVDSFQGGERNKVIYGFTRSNRDGKIGFLKELRRLNVAMTRAQQQLVLVGNFPMLTRANDAEFRYVVASLCSYAGQHGETLSLAEAYSRIQQVGRGKDWQ
jgi:hypothetical protein